MEDKYTYEKFLNVNIQIIKDHFHMLLLFVINIVGLAVLDNNQIEYFLGKCFVITIIFSISRFMHIYQTIFVN